MNIIKPGFLAAGTVGIAIGLILASAFSLGNTNSRSVTYPIQSYSAYKVLVDKTPILLDAELAGVTKGVMERSMFAHINRDADGAIAELGDNYSWMRVFEGGATAAVSGRELAGAITKNLYSGDIEQQNYLGSNSRPLAIVGNLGIQLEMENYRREDGSIAITNIVSILEVRDGKIWRLWAFQPTDAQTPDSK